MAKGFTRMQEDFICGQCGASVRGDGYTNHCPRCLFSRHVDINPGDRAAVCGGLMEPVAVEIRGDRHSLMHRCRVCGHRRRNRTADNDSMDAIVALMASGPWAGR